MEDTNRTGHSFTASIIQATRALTKLTLGGHNAAKLGIGSTREELYYRAETGLSSC